MRAFVAIPLPSEVRATLVRVRDAIVAADPAWEGEKWVAEENLHLTLRFLGDVPAGAALALADALRGAVAPIEPFTLRLTGVRAVPSAGRAQMLWAAFDADEPGAAQRLARAVTEATEDWGEGGASGDKPFRPHATLVRARRKQRVSPETLALADEVVRTSSASGGRAMSVSHAMLFSSTLTPRGPLYEEIAKAVLGGD